MLFTVVQVASLVGRECLDDWCIIGPLLASLGLFFVLSNYCFCPKPRECLRYASSLAALDLAASAIALETGRRILKYLKKQAADSSKWSQVRFWSQILLAVYLTVPWLMWAMSTSSMQSTKGFQIIDTCVYNCFYTRHMFMIFTGLLVALSRIDRKNFY